MLRRCLASLVLITSAPAAAELPDTLDIARALVIERGPTAERRSAIIVDHHEARLATGEWRVPTPGDTVAFGAEKFGVWRETVANDEGWLDDEALRGGYAYVSVNNPSAPTVRMLHAEGPRHVYVNGEPRVGDFYYLGFADLPIRLREGDNGLLFRGARGPIRARLEPPRADVFISDRDLTLASVVRGESEDVPIGVVLVNATLDWQSGLSVTSTTEGGEAVTGLAAPMPPVSVRKITVPVVPESATGDDSLRVLLRVSGDTEVHDELRISLPVHGRNDKHVRSFVSDIDGSAQHYAVTPPSSGVTDSVGLVLTLHGAGVRGDRQAHHYRPRDWAVIVSPTNRREFGFDWEDWGRLDALEVLEDARTRYDTDPRATWLTGHSMGGHGTWNLGAHFPDRFGAIGPSAGWRDFWSYGGGADVDSADAVMSMIARSANGSRTLLLLENLSSLGVYVLHGERDETVPVEQARTMRTKLAEFHPNWVYYERPGAGHWWGDECMDWPPLLDFLRANPRPPAPGPRTVSFTTVNPAVSSGAHWVKVISQARSLEPSIVHARVADDSSHLVIDTDNIEHLELRPHAFVTSPAPIVVDGDTLPDVRWAPDQSLHLTRSAHTWVPSPPSSILRKSPRRAGPFKEAFANRSVFVVGTGGTAAENAWALAKARYDAEVLWYRGNAHIEVVRDTDVREDTFRERNVILYGHADMNRAWSRVLDSCPIAVHRGVVRVGDRENVGDDVACLFVFPRKGSDAAAVGVVAGTGLPGLRLTHQLPYFVSGVGYPDWTVISVDMLTRGADGIRGAGFFTSEWTLGDDAAWR